jgi:2-methylisocitrate lyase-like PEP mutase family enzyme
MLPGAFNALSARMIEQEGFEAFYVSGAVLANSVGGVLDVGLMTLTESRDHIAQVAGVTSIPILADADTGYGGPENAARTVRVLEAAGVSGIHLEDQEFPKRCGHLERKRLVPTEEFCEKIAAAVAAKASSDFLLIARTDARGVEGYDAAVRRAHAYLKAGADGVIVGDTADLLRGPRKAALPWVSDFRVGGEDGLRRGGTSADLRGAADRGAVQAVPRGVARVSRAAASGA